ncbi:M15 family metallopeptidase [Candidatus Parcubacteria bacterium]|nr:M15 family metallopeptidase [Candidatus Parcubacteria bacterium]
MDDRVVVLEPVKLDCEIVNGKKHIYKNQCLPENYEPQVLTELSKRASWLGTYQYLDIRAKMSIEQLIVDAEKDGMCLAVVSSYRSKEEQQRLIDDAPLSHIAFPGQSEHHTGLAVDLGACPMKDGKRDDSVERLELKNPFGELLEYQWLKRNAEKYGFEESYREDNRSETGYPPEPWHWKMIVR